MASNQKMTHQQKRHKTNCFLTCFGFSTKPSSSSSSSKNKKKKKPKKIETRKKLFKFKLRWPKLIKVITIEKRRFSFDNAKAAILKTSHDIILEATKAHQQLKRIDHRHVSNVVKEPKVTSKRMIIPPEKQISLPKNQLQCATCHKEDHHKAEGAVLRRSSSTNKVIKDSLFGVTIMISMLIIMSIWGRLCAILCMSAWLYCIPLLRGNRDVAITPRIHTSNTKLDTGKADNNLNLELYKKKVVLQGLLQRDHKNAIGIS